MATEESQVIAQVLGGDIDAFGFFLRRYGDRVYALLAGMMGDGAEAEEATQDVFLQAYNHLDSFEGRSHFATWLYRIAYNVAQSRTRRHRFRTESLDDMAREMPDIDDEQIAVLFESTDANRLQLLDEALDSLPPDDRAIVDLYYFDDYAIRDIAYVVGQTETNVQTRLYRIRKRLYLYIIRNEE